jgi:uncharacterized protein with GYD domain
MAHYLVQVAYSQASTKAMLANPQPREDVIRKTIESLGGKLHAFFFAFGEYDVVLIAEAPDNKTAASLALAVGATGSVSKYVTTVLMTSAEGVEAMKAAKKVSYAAPQ